MQICTVTDEEDASELYIRENIAALSRQIIPKLANTLIIIPETYFRYDTTILSLLESSN